MIHYCNGAREDDLVAPAKFTDQAEDVMVSSKPVVVVFFHPPIPVGFSEATGQSTNVIGGFVDGYLISCTSQVIGSSHAADASADDSDFHRDPSLRSGYMSI